MAGAPPSDTHMRTSSPSSSSSDSSSMFPSAIIPTSPPPSQPTTSNPNLQNSTLAPNTSLPPLDSAPSPLPPNQNPNTMSPPNSQSPDTVTVNLRGAGSTFSTRANNDLANALPQADGAARLPPGLGHANSNANANDVTMSNTTSPVEGSASANLANASAARGGTLGTNSGAARAGGMAGSGGLGGLGLAEEENESAPGYSWRNRRAMEEMQKAREGCLDGGFTLREFGDPFMEQIRAQRVG